MDYNNEYFPLSNLLLWRKGWYVSSDSHDNCEDMIIKCLKLDGWGFCKDVDDAINIILSEYDRYCEWRQEQGLINHNHYCLYNETNDIIIHNKMYYDKDISWKTATILAILNYLAWIPKDEGIHLKKPYFDRALYKKGLKNNQKGTYKQANKFADTYLWDIFEKQL